MDIANMSLGELQKLKSAVEKEINGRHKKQRNKALEELKTIAAKYGMKLAEVVGGASPKRKARKSGGRTAAKSAVKSAPKEKKILYRHPDNAALIWGGGRGRRPQWVKDWEASGRNIEEARIT